MRFRVEPEGIDMRLTEFSTQVSLPCRIHFGSHGKLEAAGTTRRMDVRALTLSLDSAQYSSVPQPSEKVLLEIPLPGRVRYLQIRGEVTRVRGPENGLRQVDVRFRRAMFRDIAAREPEANAAPDKERVM